MCCHPEGDTPSISSCPTSSNNYGIMLKSDINKSDNLWVNVLAQVLSKHYCLPCLEDRFRNLSQYQFVLDRRLHKKTGLFWNKVEQHCNSSKLWRTSYSESDYCQAASEKPVIADLAKESFLIIAHCLEMDATGMPYLVGPRLSLTLLMSNSNHVDSRGLWGWVTFGKKSLGSRQRLQLNNSGH